MLWIMTGHSASCDDGLLYVIEAETEDDVYKEVAFRMSGLEFHRIEKHQPVAKAASVDGALEDSDEFGDDEPYVILLRKGEKLPTYEDVDNGECFYGWTCCASPLVVGMNHSDVVQW